MKPGPYLVLPFFGPSTVRDTVALPVDWRGYVLDDIYPVSVRNSFGRAALDRQAGQCA